MGRGTHTTDKSRRQTRRADAVSTQSLREQTVSPSARVDRDQGVIRGVKVLGLESSNGRRYTLECLKRAARLYEDRSVRIDHPHHPDDQRPSSSVFGWLKDIQLREDGLYGDLHYLKSHKMAETICEAAERNPRLFGLSHNAEGSGATVDGVFVVEEIVEVRSVDVVADPATTTGLFESRHKPAQGRNPCDESKQVGGRNREGTSMAVKWSEFMEAVISRIPDRKRKASSLLLLQEMCDSVKEMHDEEEDIVEQEPGPDMEALPPADGNPDEQLLQGFIAACTPLLHDALGGDTEALKKLNDYVKTHAKMAGKAAEVVAEEEGDEEEEEVVEGEDKEKEEDDKKPMEGKQRKKMPAPAGIDALAAMRLCESSGVSYDSTLLGCLMNARTDEERKQILEREKKSQQLAESRRDGQGGSGQASGARTQVPGKGGNKTASGAPSSWRALAESRNGKGGKS